MWTDLRSPHAMNPGPESFFWRICWYLPRCKIRTNFQPLMEAATYHVRHAFTMMIMMVQFVHQLLTLCAWTTAFAPPGAAFSTSETSSKVTKTCCLGYEHMAHMAMNHSMLPKHNCVMHWYTFNLDNPNHKKQKRPLQTRFAFDIDSSQNIKQKMCCRFGVFVCVCVADTPRKVYTHFANCTCFSCHRKMETQLHVTHPPGTQPLANVSFVLEIWTPKSLSERFKQRYLHSSTLTWKLGAYLARFNLEVRFQRIPQEHQGRKRSQCWDMFDHPDTE